MLDESPVRVAVGNASCRGESIGILEPVEDAEVTAAMTVPS